MRPGNHTPRLRYRKTGASASFTNGQVEWAVLSDARRGGDVERLCRPGAILTLAVVAELEAGGPSCEAVLGLSRELRDPPVLTVTRLELEPALATARVRVGRGSTVPLDIARCGRRWLVSFSDGSDPLGALEQAMSAASG